MITFLGRHTPFPPVSLASNGLLALGADLSPPRLLDAYRQGIFPWGTHKGVPHWYAPEQRMVLFPQEFVLHHSLRKVMRQDGWKIRLDTDFSSVLSGCANTPRPGQTGTWLDPNMQAAYLRLYELGWGHCVSVSWQGQLVGGIYGLAIGRMFYAESMFSQRSNASKIALAHLVSYLHTKQFGLIDCQVHTPHLASLGAKEIPRTDFMDHVKDLTQDPAEPERWPSEVEPVSWDFLGQSPKHEPPSSSR